MPRLDRGIHAFAGMTAKQLQTNQEPNMTTIIPLMILKDNIAWLIINEENQYCAIVDPGESKPIIKFLQANKLKPTAILITHHHYDHTGGIQELLKPYQIPVYGPKQEHITSVSKPVTEPDIINIPKLNLVFKVLDIPGHTKGHVAYYSPQASIIFTGDTLFSAGCGRIFEGTVDEMYCSLQKISQLPDNTEVFCAHDYTLTNLRFAQTIEPNNPVIKALIKSYNNQTPFNLPSNLKLEKLMNPFLRCQEKSVIEYAQQHSDKPINNPTEIFQYIRDLKDNTS
jgi:hydroxyacylglutathione hydrolase